MIRLTQTVTKGGCAAKIAASTLRNVLSNLKIPNVHPDLLVGGDTFDDAGVFKVSDTLACVETLDFFTPIVDTPFKFGKIAAVNALSDVYAMGGTPKTCMAILAFPLSTLDESIMSEVLAGACEAISEAEALLVGGHSIDDDTIKFGLSVTGHVHPERIWANSGARVGDDLILTKALGTGTLCAGLKKSLFTENDIEEAIESMMTLNKIIDLVETPEAIHAATDITGFGLLGHSMQMAKASNVSMKFKSTELPALKGAIDSLREKNLTKAHRSNDDYTKEHVNYAADSSVNEETRLLMRDPQTSGGLLLSVAPEHSEQLINSLRKRFPRTSRIGKVEKKNEFAIYVS
ncbi:MAG: selenide, water dikinase SelD [Bacteriovorax sp.]|jgi:selenide,water dikinase